MPGLSDKLKALGVKIGTQDIPQPSNLPHQSQQSQLPGWPLVTPHGETYLVENYYAEVEPESHHPGKIDSPFTTLAACIGDQSLGNLPLESLVFLDTETTGLAGGTGTFAFMVGVGRFEPGSFHLAQFFMRDPSEEIAQLYALEQFLTPCQALVTFNGKAFDAPLLNTRYAINGWPSPLQGIKHIDLLHISRKLWRYRLPSRTLSNLEVQILSTSRTEEDIPGWMIPQIYLDYLHNGDTSTIKNIFYHNQMDILSLASLFNHVSNLLNNPLESTNNGADQLALARLFEEVGDINLAINLYQRSMDHIAGDTMTSSTAVFNPTSQVAVEAMARLAAIYKRLHDYPPAVALWEQAAEQQHIDSIVELAKYFEHQVKDYSNAIKWTRSALDIIQLASVSQSDRFYWEPELEHRLARLRSKYKIDAP